jgi:hypothetical protein
MHGGLALLGLFLADELTAHRPLSWAQTLLLAFFCGSRVLVQLFDDTATCGGPIRTSTTGLSSPMAARVTVNTLAVLLPSLTKRSS